MMECGNNYGEYYKDTNKIMGDEFGNDGKYRKRCVIVRTR